MQVRLGTTTFVTLSIIALGAAFGAVFLMVVSVTIKSNYRKIERSLDTLGRKQLPFAYATTLNDTMKAVKKFTIERTYPRSFQVRNKAFFKASVWGKGSVRWATKQNLVVSAEDRLGRGGQKKVRGRVATPTRYVKARRTARGVPKRLRPRTVVDSAKGYLGGQSIYQTFGPRQSKRRLLYVLASNVTLRPRFPFYQDAERITKMTSSKLFKRNFRRA